MRLAIPNEEYELRILIDSEKTKIKIQQTDLFVPNAEFFQ